MTSPRETPNSNLLEPIGPYFKRKVADPGSSLVKYDTVDDQYADVVQSLAARGNSSGPSHVIMDVPVSLRRARILLDNFVVSVAATDFGGTKLCDLPDRNIAILQCELVATAKASGDYADADTAGIGIGTVVASNTTLSTTMQDVLNVSTATFTTVANAISLALSRLGATGSLTVLNVGDAATNALFLNVGNAGDELSAVGAVTFNGYVDIWYFDLGNVGS